MIGITAQRYKFYDFLHKYIKIKNFNFAQFDQIPVTLRQSPFSRFKPKVQRNKNQTYFNPLAT
ncbi:hypothetical protein CAPN004_05770 [Capnocytophaga cynodegmi]|nr:hypothetical protein CAPN004_05770 [Capnocytophaga cynodegmi]